MSFEIITHPAPMILFTTSETAPNSPMDLSCRMLASTIPNAFPFSYSGTSPPAD